MCILEPTNNWLSLQCVQQYCQNEPTVSAKYENVHHMYSFINNNSNETVFYRTSSQTIMRSKCCVSSTQNIAMSCEVQCWATHIHERERGVTTTATNKNIIKSCNTHCACNDTQHPPRLLCTHITPHSAQWASNVPKHHTTQCPMSF